MEMDYTNGGANDHKKENDLYCSYGIWHDVFSYYHGYSFLLCLIPILMCVDT